MLRKHKMRYKDGRPVDFPTCDRFFFISTRMLCVKYAQKWRCPKHLRRAIIGGRKMDDDQTRAFSTGDRLVCIIKFSVCQI